MSFVDFRYFGEANRLHFSWHLLANFLKPTYAREPGQDGCRHSTVLGPAVAGSAASGASFRSPTGGAWAPFQPRTRKRGRRTTAPLPRNPCRIAATGIIRSTAG